MKGLFMPRQLFLKFQCLCYFIFLHSLKGFSWHEEPTNIRFIYSEWKTTIILKCSVCLVCIYHKFDKFRSLLVYIQDHHFNSDDQNFTHICAHQHLCAYWWALFKVFPLYSHLQMQCRHDALSGKKNCTQENHPQNTPAVPSVQIHDKAEKRGCKLKD